MQSKQFTIDKPYIIENGIHAPCETEITIFELASAKCDIRNIRFIKIAVQKITMIIFGFFKRLYCKVDFIKIQDLNKFCIHARRPFQLFISV
jgi:hypothetical protein